MSKVWLEVAEDRTRPEGGHAVIRLHGMARPTQKLTFTIDPIDTDGTGGKTRVNGAYAPLSTRVTSDGVELVVGPDVVENPALMPGTPVAIEIPAAGVRAEVLWPSITPLVRRQKPPQVVMSTARRLALVQATRDEGRTASVKTTELPAAPVLVAVAPQAAAAATGSVPSIRVVQAKVVQAKVVTPLSAGVTSLAGMAAAISASKPATAAVQVAAVVPEPRPQRAPTAGERPAQRDSEGATVVTPLAPVVNPDASGALVAAARGQPPAIVAGLPAALGADRMGRRLSGIAMMMAMMAIGCSLLVLQMMRSMRQQNGATPVVAATQPVPAVHPAQMIAAPPSAMYEIFRVPAVSPNGTVSKDIDLAKALALADTSIHGAGTQRDLREAQYWLQRALSMSLGDDRNRWALTQLGSLYAAPGDGDPNYEKSRLLWEIAAGLGDPVAMCFLGNLHLYGLGVPTSRAMAMRWYELSAQSGGCRGLDELIVRAKR